MSTRKRSRSPSPQALNPVSKSPRQEAGLGTKENQTPVKSKSSGCVCTADNELDADASKREVIILVGYPSAGKTTLARDVFQAAGYLTVNSDEFKSDRGKMKKAAKKAIDEEKFMSVLFDSTAGSKKIRKEYVEFAMSLGMSVRCIWLTTTIEVAMERNTQRGQKGGANVPPVAFYAYRKRFEEPTEEEGFELWVL